MLTLKVINLWAPPGVGKSTTAAGLFNLMKSCGESCELISEYAKDLTWEHNLTNLGNQFLISGNQDHRQRRLEGQVEWCITDSPLPSALAYCPEEYKDWLTDAVWGSYDRYENYDILLLRNPSFKYSIAGRNQTEAESLALEDIVESLFYEATEGDPGTAFEGTVDHLLPHKIYGWLKND